MRQRQPSVVDSVGHRLAEGAAATEVEAVHAGTQVDTLRLHTGPGEHAHAALSARLVGAGQGSDRARASCRENLEGSEEFKVSFILRQCGNCYRRKVMDRQIQNVFELTVTINCNQIVLVQNSTYLSTDDVIYQKI